MKTYTTDGKCLACLLEGRGVKINELRPEIRYEHVCELSKRSDSLVDKK